MLEHGRLQDKEAIIDIVKRNIIGFSMDKHSSSGHSFQGSDMRPKLETSRNARRFVLRQLRQRRRLPAII